MLRILRTNDLPTCGGLIDKAVQQPRCNNMFAFSQRQAILCTVASIIADAVHACAGRDDRCRVEDFIAL